MLTVRTKKELEKAAENICRKNGLPHAYFTHRFGKRRHFIAGYGKETFTQTYHRNITDNIALSWQGTMSEEKALSEIRPFAELLYEVAQELNRP